MPDDLIDNILLHNSHRLPDLSNEEKILWAAHAHLSSVQPPKEVDKKISEKKLDTVKVIHEFPNWFDKWAILVAALLFCLFVATVLKGQETPLAKTVSSCGAQSLTTAKLNNIYMDSTGDLCVAATVTATATVTFPYSYTTAQTLTRNHL